MRNRNPSIKCFLYFFFFELGCFQEKVRVELILVFPEPANRQQEKHLEKCVILEIGKI